MKDQSEIVFNNNLAILVFVSLADASEYIELV